MEGPEHELPDQPPADPEEWTDEQWLAWLTATDETATDDQVPTERAPTSTMSRLTRSSGGAVLGQAMLGMAQAIYGRRDDEVVVVAEGKGDTEDDEPFQVHLDPDHPERSYVTFRPPSDPEA